MESRVFLKFALSIWCVYLGFSLGYFAWNVISTKEAYEQKNRAELFHHARSARGYLENNKSKELVEVLRHALRTGLIDSFAWKKGDQWVAQEGSFSFADPKIEPEQAVMVENGVIIRVAGSEMDLYLANRFGILERIRESWKYSTGFFFKELLFFTISLSFMIGIVFRDFFRAYIVQPKEVFETKPKTLIQPKSLRKPSGLEITEEESIFVTVHFLHRPKFENVDSAKEFQKIKDSMDQLSKRYLGLRVEDFTLGSTFQFTDLKLAACFARDCYAAQENAFLLTKGWGFKFGSQSILSETIVQNWKKIQNLEKGIWIWENQTDSLFSTQTKMGIAQISKFKALSSVLERAYLDLPEDFSYFRNDRDLTNIFEDLRGNHWKQEPFLKALAKLREVKFSSQGPSVIGAYLALLRKEIAGKDSYRLSAVISVAPYVFHQNALTRELELVFMEILEGEDKRAKSNAIEAFIYFSPDREIPGIRSHSRDFDNRVSANAIVKLALERFDDSLVRKMEERLHGGSVAHVASALYAIGEIAYYYREKHPEVLNAKVDFLRLFEEIPAWVKHPNPMVRRQALVAAKKFSDTKLDQKLKKLLESNTDQGVQALFESVYGWKSSSKRVA
jgi:hypothetical protein